LYVTFLLTQEAELGMEVKRVVLWTKDREQKMVALWRSQRCLYDSNSMLTKAERQDAMSLLAAEIGVSG